MNEAQKPETGVKRIGFQELSATGMIWCTLYNDGVAVFFGCGW